MPERSLDITSFDSSEWSEWVDLENDFEIPPASMTEIINGGQTFLWHTLETDKRWVGLVDEQLVQLRISSGDRLEFSSLKIQEPIAERLVDWLIPPEEYAANMAPLYLLEDAYLKQCIEHFRGLRVLNQPLEEILLTFLCSSNKQIVQIKRMLQLIAQHFGKPVWEGFYTYPSWETISQLELEDLLQCGTGYRGKYILGSAQKIAEDTESFFKKLRDSESPEAKKLLMELPGVGSKVADCILLYGGKRYEAFPLDTWILKAMRERYGLKKESNPQILDFAKTHFGKNAGLAQQFIFAYERKVREL